MHRTFFRPFNSLTFMDICRFACSLDQPLGHTTLRRSFREVVEPQGRRSNPHRLHSREGMACYVFLFGFPLLQSNFQQH